jgi:DNA topoisomerase-1
VLAALALKEIQGFDTQAQAKRNVVRAIEAVAERLGNTVTVCRKCYIHPQVIGAYMDGTLQQTVKARAARELSTAMKQLKPEEATVLALLHRRLSQNTNEVLFKPVPGMRERRRK